MNFREEFFVILIIGVANVEGQFNILRPFSFFKTGTGSTENRGTQSRFTTAKPVLQYQQSNNQNQITNNQPLNYRGPSGSCNEVWSYQQDNGETWGRLTITNPDYNKNILQINLSLAARLQSQYVGEILLTKDDQSSSRDVVNGLPLLYRIKFPTQNPLPKPLSVYLNDRLICSTPNGAEPLTTISLKHTFSTGYADPNPPRVHYTTAPPVYTTQQQSYFTQQRPVPVQQIQQNYQNQDVNSVCGTSSEESAQSLVIGGKRAARGEWPWLVALYRSDKGNLEFFCGGTLISSNFVLTAAHCILEKQEDEPLRADFILLFMGKHSLLRWNEEGLEKRGARRTSIYPDWDHYRKSFDGDLALIEMDSPVQFAKFVRPICLWSFDADLSRVVGQTGVVVGWGTTEKGVISNNFPKKVNVPVVTNEQCLRSSDGFIEITSERTFCAGGRRGEGPCKGDSGGGLVLQQENRWYLRGIVSASLTINGICDVNKFSVYTDVAKFIPWIKSQI